MTKKTPKSLTNFLRKQRGKWSILDDLGDLDPANALTSGTVSKHRYGKVNRRENAKTKKRNKQAKLSRRKNRKK